MQHYIRSITDTLLARLSAEQQHYAINDLRECGFPEYLVNRIRLELERNLAESVTLPSSDWADMQADSVQDAWDNFLKAIRAETRIPNSFLRSVIENAVEDVLELFAEPRQTILDTLFRNEKTVHYIDLQGRRPWIVVNGHLADAVIRYMQKRDLNDISRDKALQIIRQVDEHLNAGNTPLKWAQTIESWFTLMGHDIPSSMLARYFADKGNVALSRRFDEAEEVLSKARLIEYLSLPDYHFNEVEAEAEVEVETEAKVEAEEEVETDSIGSMYQQSDPEVISEEVPTEVDAPDDSFNDDFLRSFPTEQKPELEPESESDPEPEAEAEPESEAKAEPESEAKAEPELKWEPESEFEEESETVSFTAEEAEETTSIPIWQRFLSEDDISQDKNESAYTVSQEEEEEEVPEPVSYIAEEPEDEGGVDVITLNEEAKVLLSYLSDEKDTFVEEIFKNEEIAFYNHVNQLSHYDNWQLAGRYITRDIFDRNRIDMFSDVAVLFTDRIQQYFDEKTN